MQAKRLIPDSYLRWRHGRGFGIHSPFAYNFICLTLRERLPYYAYPVLREELRRSGADMSHLIYGYEDNLYVFFLCQVCGNINIFPKSVIGK